MKFNSKVTIPLGAEEKNLIQKKVTKTDKSDQLKCVQKCLSAMI